MRKLSLRSFNTELSPLSLLDFMRRTRKKDDEKFNGFQHHYSLCPMSKQGGRIEQGSFQRNFDFCLTCIRHCFPRSGRRTEPQLACATGNFTPSKDLFELPPLLVAVAGQVCLADTGIAMQPAVAAFGWTDPLVTLGRHLCGFPHRWSWRIPLTLTHPLMLFSRRI